MTSQINTAKKRWRISNDELKLYKQQHYLHQPLTEDLGKGCSNICQLDDNLNYIETEYRPAKDLAVLSKIDNDESLLVVTLGLKGSSRFVSHQGDEIVFNEGYTAITTINSSLGERQYEANNAIQQLRFVMNQNWLARYFGETKVKQMFNKKNIRTISYKPITPQGLILAQQLRSCKVSNEVKKLFTHGQAITLLASELGSVFSSNPESPEKFTSKDKEIAHTAREILYQEFKNPPSVEQLAKRVASNQFKLKKLFHHYFNNTPYGVLLEIRMNNAYQLLKSTHCHVNIAADYVGYNHASNFSTAFIKFFGISPKNIAKKN